MPGGSVEDQRTDLEELLRKLDDFQRTSLDMSPDTRREFEAMIRMVQNRLAKAANPQE